MKLGRSALLAVVATAAFASQARAELRTQVVEYKQGNTTLEGYLAYDDAFSGKRPGVIEVDPITWTIFRDP